MLLQIVGITLVNTKNGTKYKYTTPYPHYYLFIESHKGCSKRKGFPKNSPMYLKTIFDSLMSYFSSTKKKRELPISSHYLRHFFPLFCSRLYWRIVHNWVKFILEHPTAINISFSLEISFREN